MDKELRALVDHEKQQFNSSIHVWYVSRNNEYS